MSEDKNQQKTGKQLLNDTQEAAERAHLLREMNPTSAQLETELKHEKRKHSYNRALRSTLYTLLVVAAVAVLIATMVMPILQITGTSMTPVVGQGEITMGVRGSNPQRGDIIAFYYNNKVLIIGGYLDDGSRQLALVFQLVDMRHPPSKDDLMMINYLIDAEIPFIIVFTKADKLKPNARKARMEAFKTEIPCFEDITCVEFSAITGEGVD